MMLGRVGSSFESSEGFDVLDGLEAVFVNRFLPMYGKVPMS